MRVLVVTALVVTAAATDNFYRLSSPFSFSCNETQCVKEDRSQAKEYQSLETCQLTCGQYGSLWPRPTGNTRLSKQTVKFNPENMQVTKIAVPDHQVSQMLHDATRYFRRGIHFLHPDYPKSKKTPYTEEEKLPFTHTTPQFSKRPTPFIRETPIQQQQQQQQQQQSQHEFDNSQEQTYENWERYSPFHSQKYSSNIDRQRVNIEITVASGNRKLRLDTDEGYDLEVKTAGDETNVKIQAQTYFGARHALETLSQMIAFDDTNNALMIIKEATVQDSPQFKYRGFMLDTSRNYYPKEDLMHLMDAMSQNKMNYFQWHITDAASFPMYTENRPEMSYYGSYSPRKVYYPEDIREVVEYATLRGVNVVPEINGPGHTNAGWQWGRKSGKGELVLCAGEGVNQRPWYELSKEPPSGQLNPVNPEVYNVLGDIYRDTLNYFEPEMVHMGGDDVSFKCWQNSDTIKEYLAANSREVNSNEMFELWNVFQSNAYAKMVESAGPERQITPIIHSSSFVPKYIDKSTYIVQINEFTTDSSIAKYVKDGYKVIFSNLDQWRVDCIDTTWVGEKSANCPREIPNWRNFYRNSPLDLLTDMGIPNIRAGQGAPRENVLGGSVSLYSSETDANGLDSKAWPRVSAMAERLWSDPALAPQGIDTAHKRLNLQRQRMVYRGINAAPTQPEFCMQNESACYSREEYTARTANIPQQQA